MNSVLDIVSIRYAIQIHLLTYFCGFVVIEVALMLSIGETNARAFTSALIGHIVKTQPHRHETYCLLLLNFSVSDAVYKRKVKFLTKLLHSDNMTCTEFTDIIYRELASLGRTSSRHCLL